MRNPGGGCATPEGIAPLQKGSLHSRKGCSTPERVAPLQRGSPDSGRGRATPEGVTRLRKGLRDLGRGCATLKGVARVWRGSCESRRGRERLEGTVAHLYHLSSVIPYHQQNHSKHLQVASSVIDLITSPRPSHVLFSILNLLFPLDSS